MKKEFANLAIQERLQKGIEEKQARLAERHGSTEAERLMAIAIGHLNAGTKPLSDIFTEAELQDLGVAHMPYGFQFSVSSKTTIDHETIRLVMQAFQKLQTTMDRKQCKQIFEFGDDVWNALIVNKYQLPLFRFSPTEFIALAKELERMINETPSE